MKERRFGRLRITRHAMLFSFVAAAALSFLSSAASVSAQPEAGQDDATTIPPFVIQPPGHIAPLRFGALLTADVGIGPDRVTNLDSGFAVSDVRLAVEGKLEAGFGYFVLTNFVQSRPLLDLIIDWRPKTHGFRAAAGYFRTPFSAELLIPAPMLDFVERSQIVRVLAPGRQIGVQLDQKLMNDALVAHLGAFNGNGLETNDDNRLLYTLRLDGRVRSKGDGNEASELQYGVNVAYSEDDDARLGLNVRDPFEGTRLITGADLRWTSGPVFVSLEGIYGSIDPVGLSRRDVFGYQASVGWDVTNLVQLLARYDALWAGSLSSDRDLAITSIVLNFTQWVSFQAELRVPVRGDSPTPGGVANITLTF